MNGVEDTVRESIHRSSSRNARRRVGPALALAIAAASSAAAQEPAVAFEEKALVITGIAPGGRAAVFGISRSYNGFLTVVGRTEDILLDDDSDGALRWEPGIVISPRSVWVVVDLEKGGFSVALPAPEKVIELPLPTDAVRRGLDGKLDRLTSDRSYLELFLARPGAEGGAWATSANDGGLGDEDVAEGAVEADVASFTSIGTSPEAPAELTAGDVVVVVDRRSLDFSVAKLAE